MFELTSAFRSATASNPIRHDIGTKKEVGVGMTIADHPLHRSGRATLPRPAPTLGEPRQMLVGVRAGVKPIPS